jgi:quercetin dioxygenase-like cupin family protein
MVEEMTKNEGSNFFSIENDKKGIFRELSKGVSTRIFPGEQAMISVVRVEPNAHGKLHSHPEEQWGYLVEGSVKRIQGGKTFEVIKGDFWRTPSNVVHGVIGGSEGAVILDIFAPPKSDYLKPGKGFGGKN